VSFLKKSFNRNRLVIMSLGNIIGSGIFLGSSTVISVAGPAAVLAYLFGGLLMAFEVMFIIEMCIINPAPGAFRVHAAEIFGPWIGFVNGWMFWCSGILGMASEVAAAAVFTRFWLPQIPQWILCVLYAGIMALINLCDLKGLSRIESALASVKVIALVLFILLGLLTLLHVVRLGALRPADPFSSAGTFLPHGVAGIFASMIMVMFSFTGTGIIGLAVADTEDPGKNAPSAVAVITAVVVALYVLSILFLVLFSPKGGFSPTASPYVEILRRLRIPYSDAILNFIVLTAALSGLNSSMYSSSRMLSSLGHDGLAPKFFSKTSKNGVPVFALLTGSGALLLTAVLSYLIPQKVFVLLATASGFLAMFNWLTISFTHYFYRKRTLKRQPEKLRYRAPGYPYTSFGLAAAIIVLFCTSPLYPGQVSGLVGSVALLAALAVCYFLLKKMKLLR
jgi:Gamma-aminobutyrate permease and related permeases